MTNENEIMERLLNFHESFGKEIELKQNRVRDLIGNIHWLEDGNYKERLIRDLLRNNVPSKYIIKSGFIIFQHGVISTQIDILILKTSARILFMDNDFVVVTPECVSGVIEVKTSLDGTKMKQAVTKLNEIGKNFYEYSEKQDVFFGLYCINFKESLDTLKRNYIEGFDILKSIDKENRKCYVSTVVLGKYLVDTLKEENSIYSIVFNPERNLSFSYFLFNLLESLDVEEYDLNELYGIKFPLVNLYGSRVDLFNIYE